jgi:YD repeat-containing protein
VTGGTPTTFTYTLDAMERPTAMTDQTNKTWASGATYNAANQPLYDGTATRTYNNLLQMTSIAASGMNMTYNYSANQNNGQITSSVDAITGETITYQYDALKRLLVGLRQELGRDLHLRWLRQPDPDVAHRHGRRALAEP